VNSCSLGSEYVSVFLWLFLESSYSSKDSETIFTAFYLDLITNYHRKSQCSSSIGITARCGLWPVEQYRTILSCLSPTLSIFSFLTLENLFYFLFPSFPGSSPSSRPFQFLNEDLFLGILS